MSRQISGHMLPANIYTHKFQICIFVYENKSSTAVNWVEFKKKNKLLNTICLECYAHVFNIQIVFLSLLYIPSSAHCMYPRVVTILGCDCDACAKTFIFIIIIIKCTLLKNKLNHYKRTQL